MHQSDNILPNSQNTYLFSHTHFLHIIRSALSTFIETRMSKISEILECSVFLHVNFNNFSLISVGNTDSAYFKVTVKGNWETEELA